jgi:hypothetical protein
MRLLRITLGQKCYFYNFFTIINYAAYNNLKLTLQKLFLKTFLVSQRKYSRRHENNPYVKITMGDKCIKSSWRKVNYIIAC